MVRQDYQNNYGFSLVEMITVLFVVSLVIIILSINPIHSFSKYKERISLNEVISNIYLVQTESMKEDRYAYIEFLPNNKNYILYYNGSSKTKIINENGVASSGFGSVQLKYKKGNLVSKANTIYITYKNSLYKIVIHLDTGYITVYEE